MRYVAVIDIGKTNTKLALVDTANAKEICVLKQPSASGSNNLYPSLDTEAIEEFIVESLRSLSSQHTIDAITVTTHGATVALIDATGKLALPVLDYEFAGIDELRPDYNLHRPPFSDSGSPALPGGLNVGAQLHWQQITFPEQFATVHSILTWPQYWVYRLTGELHNDVSSLGAHTDLYEPAKRQYSTLVTSMGWDTIMPPTRLSGELSGTLTPHIAALINLPVHTPVYSGIHDSNASLVPHLLAQSPPFTVISTGTWFIAMSIGVAPATLDETRDTLLNVNAYGDAVPSARFMGGREREMLGIAESGTDSDMHQLLSAPADAIFFLPSVVPGTGPFPESAARWIGRLDEASAGLRDCAVTLYLALMTHECMKLIGSEGPIFIEGPLAHDSFYVQMLAAASNRTVWASDSQTGTSVGAAMLIARPLKQPDYRQVTVDELRRQQLSDYAEHWQYKLHSHLR